MTGRAWKARLTEDPIPGDPDTQKPVLHYHAYSQSGELTAPVVYAASGNPENYDWLEAHGIDVKGKIVLVRYSVPYSYRGFKALTAEKRGAAGLLIYSDPMEDGTGKGEVYPDGPWGNDSHMQSGGIPYDFMVPGDPLTPGWASVPGAKRIPREEAVSLPKIISSPLSARDARTILETMEGPEAPKEWQGGLPIKYRVGPGAAGADEDRPRRQGPAHPDRDRPHSRVVGPRPRGDRRQPPRRVDLRRGRSVQRHGVDDGPGAIARRAGPRGRAAEALDRLRELGRRGVHAHLVHRVGRAARGGPARSRRRVSQRGQLHVRSEVHGSRGPLAQPVHRGSRGINHAIRRPASRFPRRRSARPRTPRARCPTHRARRW